MQLLSLAVFAVTFRSALSADVATQVAAGRREMTENAANPIRKVVTMLQSMQKKVTAEGAREKELYEKYVCYCKNNGQTLSQSIAAANTKVPAVQSEIEASVSQKAQLEEELKQHRADRTAAKEAREKAAAVRATEAAAFAAEKADFVSNLDALEKAIYAITKGMAGGFLQTGTARQLRKIATTTDFLSEPERRGLLAFLAGKQNTGYVPKSAEIVGILKQIQEDMEKGLAEATRTENDAIQGYEALVAAKGKEEAALTQSIEVKSMRAGELEVSIVQMRNDLTDTEKALIDDKKFAADLEKSCAEKAQDWETRSKARQEELLALAETIRVLNDDEALDLFKKTLPSAEAAAAAAASASLVQVQASAARERALASLREARRRWRQGASPDLDFVALAIKGRKVGFEQVIKMIDQLVADLKKEQVDDENKKEYCATALDKADDDRKSLQQGLADTETAISQAEDVVAVLKEEILALEASIVKLDKAVAEATEQRKNEHAQFTDLVASNAAAKDLLHYAINRLNKFYNINLYKAPPKRELTEDERIMVNMGGTLAPTNPPGGIAGTGIGVLAEVSSHVARGGTAGRKHVAAPPPPPETYGAYAKREETGGVVAMMQLLITDLEKDTAAARVVEADSQTDYETAMRDSASKRATDDHSLTTKRVAKATVETEIEEHSAWKANTQQELATMAKYFASLHAECDWLLQYFDMRREARSSEIDALSDAKAVLNGADYALMQKQIVRNLLARN